MALDLPRDRRRAGLALGLAGLALAAALAVAGLRGHGAEWRRHQDAFRAAGLLPRGEAPGLRQTLSCRGEVERCTTCHLGALRRDLAGRELGAPLQAHPPRWLELHPPETGCTDCHGGVGRALDGATAHGLPDGSGRDPQLRGLHQQARCARCHAPAAALGLPGVAAGAALYLELGCSLCHPLSAGGLGGYDFGPDLRALGRRSLRDLTDSLVDPSANFAESTMPSFRATFEERPESLQDLLVFLESLVLEPGGACDLRGRSATWVAAPCASCHAGPAGRAGGRFRHACVYLQARAAELSCARCHPAEVPAPSERGGTCPLVEAHRSACSACHPVALRPARSAAGPALEGTP